MSYIRTGSSSSTFGGLGCGPGCNCAPCRARFAGYSESYIPEEEDEQQEPEQAPPPPESAAPPPPETSAEAAAPSPTEEPKPNGKTSPDGGPEEPSKRRPGRRRLHRLRPRRRFSGRLHGYPFGNAYFGNYGWSVRTPLSDPGHEVITLNAMGPSRTISFTVGGRPMSRVLAPNEVDAIIAGNRSVDLGWMGTGVVFSLAEKEQRRHSLRKNFGQPIPDALADIVNSLRAQHAGILAETNPLERCRKIGMASHLVQDSFSPAHTERDAGAAWCIRYIRNFGRGRAPREHGTPSDDRDKVRLSASAASQAEDATRRYFQIVWKAVYGRTKPDPTAVSEAAAEFNRFISSILRLC